MTATRESASSRPWAGDAQTAPTKRNGPNDPFIASPFLEAAAHFGPGRGRVVVLESACGASVPARWGILERATVGVQVASAWTGPFIPAGGARHEVWRTMLKELATRRSAFLRMNMHASLRLTEEDVREIEAVAADRRWRVTRTSFGSNALDLTRPEADLLKEIHKEHRRMIRLGDEVGLVLDTVDSSGVDAFVSLMAATYARQGLRGPPEAYIRGLAEIPRDFRLYAARTSDGVVHAVALIARRAGTGIYLHGGSGERAVRGAGNWIHWQIARALAHEGFERYDLGGFAVDSDEGRAAGIRAFKLRFGGAVARYDAVDVDFKPFMSRVIRDGLTFSYRAKKILRKKGARGE